MRKILLAAIALAFVATACGDDTGAAGNADATLRVVATTTVVADFAWVIGGVEVTVYDVVKPNVDAHDYEPSPADLNAIKQAVVIVKNGVGFEEWLDTTITASGTKAAIVDASEGVTIREGDHEREGDHDKDAAGAATGGAKEHEHEDGDPHIWQDPRNAKLMVTNIAKGLAAADPAGTATYEKNLATYLGQLETLDQELERRYGSLANKKLVTNHDAFGYLVDRYGLEFAGSIIPSFDTSAELSASDLADLVASIKAEGVKAVFSEASLPAKTAKTIANEAKVNVVAGDDALYGDGLGTTSSDGGTYLKMMRHNANTIVKNLS